MSPDMEKVLGSVRMRLLLHRDIPRSAHGAVNNIIDQAKDEASPSYRRIIMQNPQSYADKGRSL
jgi:hypothetical protein